MHEEINIDSCPEFFLSNRIEQHYNFLREMLFSSKKGPFCHKIVVVPSYAMRSWLMEHMAKDPLCGIAAGVDFQFIDMSVDQLLKRYLNCNSFIPNTMQLALKIESEIRKSLKNIHAFDLREQYLYQPLIEYLKFDRDKSLKRLPALSEHLAFLFTYYGSYAPEVVAEWEKLSKKDNWQQKLWCEIFSKWDYVNRASKMANFNKLSDKEVEYHFFGFSFIPKYQHEIFCKVSKYLDVNYYILSPCKQFWSDIRSDKEIRHIHSYLSKRSITEDNLQDFEAYLYDNNPLLANYGKLGREFAQVIEDIPYETVEAYYLPEKAQNIEHYKELIYTDLCVEKSDMSLLKAIQTDILLMRNPVDKNTLSFDIYDKSVQIDVCSTPLREIEVLYDNILERIYDNSQGGDVLYQEDIVVMATDISEYVPYIKAVFGKHDSKLGYNIRDVDKNGNSYLIESFLRLFELRYSRWDVADILSFFDIPAVQRRFGLKLEDVALLRRWVKAVNIKWGMNSDHRDKLIKFLYPSKSMLEKSSISTWEYGIIRWIDLMACEPEGGIELSNVDVLGKIALILRSLYEDLSELQDDKEKSFCEWVDFIECLFEAYYLADDKNHDEQSDKDAILETLYKLRSLSVQFEEDKFAFSSVLHHFEKTLDKSLSSYMLEKKTNAITFCSILPMRAVPSKVISLIGMSEDKFPRKEIKQSMNLVADDCRTKYFPLRTDFDRYLYLETILSARDSLLISYVYSDKNKVLSSGPSAAVEEFIGFCDKAYLIEGKAFSDKAVRVHPHYPFHKEYFVENTKFRSFSIENYMAAKAFYNSNLDERYIVSRDLYFPPDKLDAEELSIDCAVLNIKDLSLMARNPIKAFFNKTLGMYLIEENNGGDTEFTLSHLDRYIFKKEALQTSLVETMREDSLPLGAMRDVSCCQLKEEMETLYSLLASMEIDFKGLHTVELSLDCEQAYQFSSDKWISPAIKVETSKGLVSLIGEIDMLLPEGLISLSKDYLSDGIKNWPLYLVLACMEGLPFERNLLMVKGAKIKTWLFDNPKNLLAKYLEYYFIGLNSCSPLLPDLVNNFINDDIQVFKANFDKIVFGGGSFKYNDYLKKVYGVQNLADVDKLQLLWKDIAISTYGDMIGGWYSKKVR